MKIYDISQELLSAAVYPGDPTPRAERIFSIPAGDPYNLTFLSLCAHNGTHVDAPCHFLDGGADIASMPLDRFVGAVYLTTRVGELTATDAAAILDAARDSFARSPLAALDPDGQGRRIIIRGDATVILPCATALAAAGIYLLGTELQSVGPIDSPMAVHLALLSRGTALLEGLRIPADIPDGTYLLAAQPIAVSGADGSPCRAILIAP